MAERENKNLLKEKEIIEKEINKFKVIIVLYQNNIILIIYN